MSRVKLKYMAWYISDYQNDEFVRLLTDRQDVWYRRLLEHQWQEGGLPDDSFAWWAIVRPREVGPDDPEWERFVDMVPGVFSEKRNGRRFNKRNVQEYDKQVAAYRARVKAAEDTNKTLAAKGLDG